MYVDNLGHNDYYRFPYSRIYYPLSETSLLLKLSVLLTKSNRALLTHYLEPLLLLVHPLSITIPSDPFPTSLSYPIVLKFTHTSKTNSSSLLNVTSTSTIIHPVFYPDLLSSLLFYLLLPSYKPADLPTTIGLFSYPFISLFLEKSFTHTPPLPSLYF